MEPPSYAVGKSAECPHCNVHVRFEHFQGMSPDGSQMGVPLQVIMPGGIGNPVRGRQILLTLAKCPQCENVVIAIKEVVSTNDDSQPPFSFDKPEMLAWPRHAKRAPLPQTVPAYIAQDYEEAALVLADSPKASATLSRRCLQAVLREQGYNQRQLDDQIKAARANLPNYIGDDLDHIREIGNFGAHPNKNTNTSEIIEVETGEAEWNLHVLDLVFDQYYAYPAKAKEMRDAAKAKAQSARKQTPQP